MCTVCARSAQSYFRPEFLNRLDEVIVFRQLTKKEVKQIADIFLKGVFQRAEEKGIKIEVSAAARGHWRVERALRMLWGSDPGAGSWPRTAVLGASAVRRRTLGRGALRSQQIARARFVWSLARPLRLGSPKK